MGNPMTKMRDKVAGPTRKNEERKPIA